MKKGLIALVLLLLFSSYKPQKLFFNNGLNIKEINIKNNFILKDSEIKKKLTFLYDTNLFFLNTRDIENKLKEVNYIKSFEIKKIYPNKLKIKITEKKPIVILYYKKEKFYLSESFDLINYIDLEDYKNIPVVYGNKNNFRNLYKDLYKINFPIDLIESYYLYDSNRWDLKTNKKKVIKLPQKNYIDSLKNYMKLINEDNFAKFKVFDYRINNQLILK